jgi:hypothetical protein
MSLNRLIGQAPFARPGTQRMPARAVKSSSVLMDEMNGMYASGKFCCLSKDDLRQVLAVSANRG